MDEMTQRAVMAAAWAGVAWWALACVAFGVAWWGAGRCVGRWLQRRAAADAALTRELVDAVASEIAVEVLAAGYPLARIEVLSYGDESSDAVPQVRVVMREDA